MKKPIYDISPFTLLDFPHHTACILWFAGCNMRCGYCYNPEIVLGKGKISIDNALEFIESRRYLLDGVVFSGGECSLHPELCDMAMQVKKWGMKVKIDTNGSQPKILRQLIENDSLDYLALDFKAPSVKFEQVTSSRLFAPFLESLNLLVQEDIDFEVRTTVHSTQLKASDIHAMTAFLRYKGYKGKYYLQLFVGQTTTLSPLPDSDISEFKEDFSSDGIQVILREGI